MTIWEILKSEGIAPAPNRSVTTWADFPRSQANTLLSCDFIETVTLTGGRQYIHTVIEHSTRRVRILGTTTHPTATWVAQTARNLVMDLEDTATIIMYLIRDRDAKYPDVFDRILSDSGTQVVLTGVRIPQMNAIHGALGAQTCRRELLDRTFIWNESHLRHALREFERHHNAHRPHQALNRRPLREVPEPITDPGRISRLDIRRRDRLAGVIHEYRHAA